MSYISKQIHIIESDYRKDIVQFSLLANKCKR